MSGAVLGVPDPDQVAVEVGQGLGGPAVAVAVPGVLGLLRVPAATRAWCQDDRVIEIAPPPAPRLAKKRSRSPTDAIAHRRWR